jgi:methionyl-tRNA formyltransferase
LVDATPEILSRKLTLKNSKIDRTQIQQQSLNLEGLLMKVVFFGTPQFAANVLESLIKHNIQVVAIITKPDRPQGRSKQLVPTPVKQVACAQVPHIPLFQPEVVSAAEFTETMASFQADLFVVVAYGEIIKQHLLDMPKIACINLHASLLPKYRGAAPIQRAIMSGEDATGVTIMHMVRKMDAGDIIKTVSIPIDPDQTFPEIEANLCQVGQAALLDVINDLKNGCSQRFPQLHEEATYAPKIELEDCFLSWHQPALDLHNLIRGVTPEPGAWCYVLVKNQKKRLRVLKSKVIEHPSTLPGKILSYGNKGLTVACGQAALQILTVQLEGKTAMSAEELTRGIPESSFTFIVEGD